MTIRVYNCALNRHHRHTRSPGGPEPRGFVVSQGVAMAGIRNGRPYRRLVAWQKRLGLPCWICGHNIPTGVDGRTHPLAFTLDHEQPLSRGGDLLDPANARSAHRRCNSARGNRTSVQPKAARQRASRRW